MGAITSAYEGHLSSSTKTLEKIFENAYAYKRVIQSTVNVNKSMMQVTKIAGKTFFVSGLIMTGVDIYQKGGSKSSIGLGLLDTGMGLVGFVPGFQLISGIYFTGRIGYQMYESYQKP